MNEPWLNFKDALKNKTKPTHRQVGIAYTLQGDSPASNTDPYAKEPKPGNDSDTTRRPGKLSVPSAPHAGLMTRLGVSPPTVMNNAG